MVVTVIDHDEPNTQPITELYVFLSRDENGDGILAASLGGLGMVPLVTGDPKNLEFLRPMAMKAAEACPDKKISLVKFSSREVIEEIT